MEEELEIFRLLEQLTKEREEFIRTRQQFLPRNVPVKRKEFQNNKAVKSDLKKSNAFVKKIKSINTEGIQQCIRDTDTLNLTLYISEIVSAILATTYKATDVSHMVKLCLSLHTKYDEFTEPLITGLKTTLLAGQGGAVSEDAAPGEGGSAGEVGKKRRIQIRFAIELYQAGLFNDDEFFLNLLRQLLGKASAISSSKGAAATPATVSASSGKGGGMIDLQGLSTFVKYGSEILFGFIPRKLLDLGKKVGKPANELPVKILASAKNSTEMRTLLLDTYQMISNDLIEAHKQYRIKEHKFEKDRLIHGSLSEQKQQELENSKKLYEKLLSVITTLSECTGENIPELKIEKFEEEGGGGITVWEGNSGNNAADDAAGNAGLFEDSETRAFYEDLPDLLSLVPLSILGFSHEQAAALQEEWAAKEKQTSEEDNENILPEQMSKMEQEIEAVGIQDDGNDDLAEIENDNDATDEGKSEAGGLGGISSKSNTSLTSLAVDESGSSSTNAAKLQELLSVKILECNTKQKADDFTVSFCYISNNSKAARKRLAQVIAKIPRQRADLAPFYGRIIASLHRLYSDILPIVIELLRKEFYGIIKTKKQTFNIDHKVKNIRLTCELMKFRIIPPIIIFRMYKTLLYDLSPHHIELLAVGLETCGRFLYQLRYTRETMEEILDTMMRLRYAKRIDLYQQTVLESAYFAVKPPEKQPAAARKKERSLLEQYVRYLILDTLDTADASTSAEMTVDVTIKALRRLPWNQIKEIPLDVYITKAAMKLARYKYTSIPNLADCLSGIAKHYPNVLTRLLDTCLEEIQRAIEIPYKRDIQRIIGYTKLIGELYNFTAIPSTLIFDLLFHLIHYGHFNLQQYLADHPAGVNNTSDNVHSAGTVFIPGQHFIPAGLTHTTLPFTSTIFMKYYDPKTIITEMDLPNDLFRTQIICELLNTCGIYYVRGHLKEKLNKFFIYFQRYLLTKQLIPLHIEFSILDTFDYLEELAREAYIEDQQTAVNAAAAAAAAAANAGITSPQVAKKGRGNFTAPGTLPVEPVIAPISFPRYDNYAEVQKIIDVFEKNTSNSTNSNANQTQKDEDEEEMLLDRREKKNSKQKDDEGKKAVAEKKNSEDVDDGDEEGDEDEEDDGDDDEDDDDEDEDGDDSDEESSDDDSEADDDEDDDDDSSDAAEEDEIDDEEEEEEAAKLLEKLRIVEEDEEFEKAFKSVVQESMNSVSVKHQDVNKMVIPAVLPKPKNNAPAAEDDQPTVTASHHHQQHHHHHHHHHSAPAAPAMKFSLLSRDNKGRVEARQLLVPKDNPMAVKLAKAEEEARLEKLRIKERTLQLNSLNNDDYDFDDLPDSSKYMGYGNTSTNVTTSTKSSGGGGAANSAVSATATAGSGVSERSSSNSSSKSDRIVTNAGIMNRKPKYHNVVRAEEVRKAPDTLNLDEFLAEANAAEIRRITSRKNN